MNLAPKLLSWVKIASKKAGLTPVLDDAKLAYLSAVLNGIADASRSLNRADKISALRLAFWLIISLYWNSLFLLIDNSFCFACSLSKTSFLLVSSLFFVSITLFFLFSNSIFTICVLYFVFFIFSIDVLIPFLIELKASKSP